MIAYESSYDTQRERRDLTEIARTVANDVPAIVLSYADDASLSTSV